MSNPMILSCLADKLPLGVCHSLDRVGLVSLHSLQQPIIHDPKLYVSFLNPTL